MDASETQTSTDDPSCGAGPPQDLPGPPQDQPGPGPGWGVLIGIPGGAFWCPGAWGPGPPARDLGDTFRTVFNNSPSRDTLLLFAGTVPGSGRALGRFRDLPWDGSGMRRTWVGRFRDLERTWDLLLGPRTDL